VLSVDNREVKLRDEIGDHFNLSLLYVKYFTC